MVCISSYFDLYAPHLRVFNLSNQNFSTPQNSRVAAFRHPCPGILTKSPHFPYLSFVPQNPPFDNFPSMASSLARMPFDEWRSHHPSRLHARTHKPFAKALTTIFTSIDPSAAAAADILPTAPASSSSAESETTEKRKVGTSSSCDESDLTAKEITDNAAETTLLPSASQSPTWDTSRKVLRVMGSQEMEGFILKLKAERLGEVAALAELYPVSQFAFRSQIQDIFIVSEGKKTSIQEQYAESGKCNWLTQSTYSRRGRGVIRRGFYNGLQNTIFNKNKGLKELLIIQEKGKEKCISFPLPSQMLQTQKNWQSSSFTYSSSSSVQEGEDIIDLKEASAGIDCPSKQQPPSTVKKQISEEGSMRMAPSRQQPTRSNVALISTEEEEKLALAAEREKRAAAAERRIAAAMKNEGGNNTRGAANDLSCSFCDASLAGRIPFHRYHYKYCSTSCMHVHREVLEDG